MPEQLPPPDLPPMEYNPPPQATYPFLNQIWFGSQSTGGNAPSAPMYYPPYMGINWQPWQPLGGQGLWTSGPVAAGGPGANSYGVPPPGFYGSFEEGGTPWQEPGALPSPPSEYDPNAYAGIAAPPSLSGDTGAPATTAPDQTPVAAPTWASSGLMGYPPATLAPPPGQGWGGWGQPMGYFGVPSQGPIGAFGVGGEGGSYFGGGIPIAPGAAGGAPSPGAIAYGLGPLPGTPGSFGGGGGGTAPYGAVTGFHSPQFQAWMAQNNINPHEMLAALVGSGTSTASTAGAYHSGAGPKGAQ